MNKQIIFRTFVRCLHDRKLPTVVPNTTPIQPSLIGTKSPRKPDYNNIYNDFLRKKKKDNNFIIISIIVNIRQDESVTIIVKS